MNYFYTISKLAYFSSLYYSLADPEASTWLLTCLDIGGQALMIGYTSQFVYKPQRSFVNLNFNSFWLAGPLRLLISLKVDGFMRSWTLVMIPFYLFSVIVITIGVILIIVKKWAYSDFWGK